MKVKDQDLDDMDDSLLPERANGIQWCVQTDHLKFHVIIQDNPLTGRTILSMVSSIYDPLGMLELVVLPAKQISTLSADT